MHCRIIDLDKEKKAWDEAADNSKNRTFFHTSDWLHFAETVFSVMPFHLIVENRGDTILALPMFLVDKTFQSPFEIDYGGFLLNSNYAQKDAPVKNAITELYRTINNLGKKAKALSIYVRPHYSNDIHIDYLKARKNRVAASYITYVLSEFYDHELLTYFHKKKRNAIRNSLKKNMAIDWISPNNEKMEEYYALHTETKKAQFSQHFPKEFFNHLQDLSKDSVKIPMASKDGKYMAGIIAFEYNGVLYILDNCSDKNYLQFNPNDFVYYHLLMYSQEKRLIVDFGRTSQEDRDLCRFKERFGSKAYPISTYMEILPPKILNYIKLSLKYLTKKIG